MVLQDGVRKGSEVSVKKATTLPSNTKIILPFNKGLQPIGQAAGLLSGFLGILGASYSHFPICEESWKHVNKAKKEHAYHMVKRIFHYKDDAGEKIKQDIMKRIEKNRKDTRHNLYHKFYKSIRTFEKNKKITGNGSFKYRQKEETKKKCKQNALNRSKQLYTHTEGSKTLTRKKDEVRKYEKDPLVEESCLSSLIRKKMAPISMPMRVLLEAIANIESQDESSKHILQNDLLAQVLGKEHSG
ncbi:hypothetical protein Ahy_B10g101882 [Arachis hypogaea]|uniref:Uncharacterized protein n=1 Tax=Arachis hypogaea TaxID=3818 RepID=A0A444X0K0_ARAHY|nr:hypothetical protein Ahy_B10g101882 [Arachis hypogaea]